MVTTICGRTAEECVLCGLGDPVMDSVVHVTSQFLRDQQAQPGGCIPVEAGVLRSLLEKASKQGSAVRIPGGSAANVMKGLANLLAGCGANVKFMGMVGADEVGREYRDKLQAQGVQPLLVQSASGAATASCLCLVTPDGQRTMRTCLGGATELASASQLPQGWSSGCAWLHCEGYCLYRPQLAAEAMREARLAGAKVSIDLASFELVRHCWPALQALLQEGLIHTVLCNEEEAVSLAEVASVAANGSSVAAAQCYLLRNCQVAVVSLGARGCTAAARSGDHATCSAPQCKVVDTVGAGDYFASGFLYAYLQGASLQACAECGCLAGSAAVQAVGADLPAADRSSLRSQLLERLKKLC